MPDEITPTPVIKTPTPVAAESPWQASIFNPEGGFVDQWQTKLPADYEEDRALLANYKDLKGITKALKENMTAARAKPAGLVIPTNDAAPEVQQAYHAELKRLYGVPDGADGYKLEKPAVLPAGVEWNDEAAKGFAAKAHEFGLTTAQAQQLIQYDMDRFGSATVARDAEAKQLQEFEKSEMAKRWGDKVDHTLNLAARMAIKLNLPNSRELFDPNSPLFAGVDMASAFAQMAQQTGEQHLPTGAAVASMDPETMAKDIMGNPSNPEYAAFRNANHPQSAAVRAKVSQLFKQGSGV